MMPRAKVEDVGCLEIAWKEICNHTKGAGGGGADQSRREKVLHNGCNIFIFPLMTRNCGGIKRISNVAPGVKVNSLYDDMMPRAKVEDVGCLEIAWKEITPSSD